LEKYILTNRTIDMVERSVYMLCSMLPQTISEPCIEFVDEYGDLLIKLLMDEEFQPREICAELGVCQSRNTQTATYDASSLGGKKCTWGPSYWCQSLFHANACGTVQHCRENVWP